MNLSSPVQWTLSILESLEPAQLCRLSLRVIATLGVCRVLLGRCLVVMDRSDAVRRESGCSGGIHYATLHGVDYREALEARRVALKLEGLPRLRQVAEVGAIEWASLREI